MKNILLLLVMLCIFVQADAQLIKKRVIDQKYLAGAVTTVDDKVVFSRSIALPKGVSADDAYNKAMNWISQYCKKDDVLKHQNNSSSIDKHLASVGIVEYMTFRKSAFVLDRTQIIYVLDAKSDGKTLDVKMHDITYYYDEERDKVHYTAENILTDEKALTKKGNKFYGGYGKFRIKTIDLFDDICAGLEKALSNNQ